MTDAHMFQEWHGHLARGYRRSHARFPPTSLNRPTGPRRRRLDVITAISPRSAN